MSAMMVDRIDGKGDRGSFCASWSALIDSTKKLDQRKVDLDRKM